MVYHDYYDDISHGEDARDSNSDDETCEPLDYQDWSTIHNEELWDMWYRMKDYLDNRYMYDELFKNIEPDDFFYDFCFEHPKEIYYTTEYIDWVEENKLELNYLWRLIREYRGIFENKYIEDFHYYVFTAKKYPKNIYNETYFARYNFSQSGDTSGPIFGFEPWLPPIN